MSINYTEKQQSNSNAVPNAVHASSLRSKFTSLQLAGYNLAFSLKFSCEPFKLQLLKHKIHTYMLDSWCQSKVIHNEELVYLLQVLRCPTLFPSTLSFHLLLTGNTRKQGRARASYHWSLGGTQVVIR